MKKTLFAPISIGLLCFTTFSTLNFSFANTVYIGRYLTVAAKPELAQRELLQQQIEITFPQNILTIKQAVQFILQFSGFTLAPSSQMDRATEIMLQNHLPEVDKSLGPMTLESALIILSGSTFYLLIDPVHRQIGFQLKPQYKNLYLAKGANHEFINY